jgi:hypothetical protein
MNGSDIKVVDFYNSPLAIYVVGDTDAQKKETDNINGFIMQFNNKGKVVFKDILGFKGDEGIYGFINKNTDYITLVGYKENKSKEGYTPYILKNDGIIINNKEKSEILFNEDITFKDNNNHIVLMDSLFVESKDTLDDLYQNQYEYLAVGSEYDIKKDKNFLLIDFFFNKIKY